VSQRAAAARGLRLAQWFGLTEKDGFVGWLPLFHCGGDESLYATFVTGGIYATFKRVDIPAMYERIERERLSWTLLLPGVITDFMTNPQRQANDLSSLRFAIGYANMMPNIVAKLTKTFASISTTPSGKASRAICSRTAVPAQAKCRRCANDPRR
jgi:fatty-acyl-CoA synthase